MMTSKFTSFVLLCTCFTIAVSADISESELTSFAEISLSECFDRCLKRTSCRGVKYKRRATYCQLYSENLGNKISWRETPGTVFRDFERSYQLTEDNMAEACDDRSTCAISECPHPPSISDARRKGNLRHIGSKVMYRCETVSWWRTFSSCQENGTWSTTDMTCETPGYKFYGSGVYMHTSQYQDRFVLHSASLEACLLKCNQSTDFCVGINFYPDNQTCVSTSLKPWRGGHPVPVDKPGWYLFTKTLPVFHVSDGRPYSYTYDNAVAFCDSFNTTLASITDVNSAFLLGFSLCSCAWVIERYSVIAIKYFNIFCFGRGNGVYSCWKADKFNLFCKDRDY